VNAQTEVLRFGAVGIVSNIALYMVYVVLTAAGIGHKWAMTAIYCLGVLLTYVLNRRWTFKHAGGRRALGRYWLAYGFCYALNLALLVLLVDIGGFPHQAVQALAICLIALLTFLLQKHWVFPG
jgi:putative flippase GtrA